MDSNNWAMAQIVMDEKNKEKFDLEQKDDIFAIEIYSKLTNMQAYKEKFMLFFDTDEAPRQYDLTPDIATILSRTLMKFETDQFKNDQLMMAEKINKKMQYDNILINGDVFDNLCRIYIEQQQWDIVTDFMKHQIAYSNCTPDQKTMKYLKSNIAYIFVNNVRLEMQDTIQKFEYHYFSLDAIKRNKEMAEAKKKAEAETKEVKYIEAKE